MCAKKRSRSLGQRLDVPVSRRYAKPVLSLQLSLYWILKVGAPSGIWIKLEIPRKRPCPQMMFKTGKQRSCDFHASGCSPQSQQPFKRRGIIVTCCIIAVSVINHQVDIWFQEGAIGPKLVAWTPADIKMFRRQLRSTTSAWLKFVWIQVPHSSELPGCLLHRWSLIAARRALVSVALLRTNWESTGSNAFRTTYPFSLE